MRTTLLILSVVVACSSSALADDLYLPPWDRYTEGTVFATWSFTEDQGEWCYPDAGAYPDTEAVWVYGGGGLPELDGREGIGLPILLVPVWAGYPEPFPAWDLYFQLVCHESGMVDEIRQMWVPTWCEITHEIELEGGWWYRRFHVWIEEAPPPGGGPY